MTVDPHAASLATMNKSRFMGIYMCMKSGCRVNGEDFAHKKYYMGIGFNQQTAHFVGVDPQIDPNTGALYKS